jgi:hypothetical protein
LGEEEFGIDVEVDHFLGLYHIPRRGRQRIIPGIPYLVIANAKAHVRLDKSQFSTCRWVRLPGPKLNFIEAVKKILDALAPEFFNSTDTSSRKPPQSERRVVVVPISSSREDHPTG